MSHHSEWIVGIDLGDQESHLCRLNRKTGEVEYSRMRMTRTAVRRVFTGLPARRVVMEVGGHSRWCSQLLEELGFDVIVAGARRIALISKSLTKNDKKDAEMLARLGASELTLLHPIHHRSDRAQKDLAVIKARDTLVRVRTQLINSVRGTVKQFGIRLGSFSTRAFVRRALSEVKACANRPSVHQPAWLPDVAIVSSRSDRKWS